MTRGDKFLILILVLGSLLSMVIFTDRGLLTERAYVSVQVNGQEVQKIQLDKTMVGKTVRVETEGGYNLIEIGDGKVRVLEADCRDQIDVLQGWISKPGETLVCLPHRLILQIIDPAEVDDIDHINY